MGTNPQSRSAAAQAAVTDLRVTPVRPTLQGKYIVPKYSKSALAGDWVLMWQDTGAVFRLHLGEDLQFESVEGMGSGQLGGRWNLWGADRFVVAVWSRFGSVTLLAVDLTQPGCSGERYSPPLRP